MILTQLEKRTNNWEIEGTEQKNNNNNSNDNDSDNDDDHDDDDDDDNNNNKFPNGPMALYKIL